MILKVFSFIILFDIFQELWLQYVDKNCIEREIDSIASLWTVTLNKSSKTKSISRANSPEEMQQMKPTGQWNICRFHLKLVESQLIKFISTLHLSSSSQLVKLREILLNGLTVYNGQFLMICSSIDMKVSNKELFHAKVHPQLFTNLEKKLELFLSKYTLL